jgi:hypothetical protein
METVDGRFERTDEIELPRSRAENSVCCMHMHYLQCSYQRETNNQ